MARWIALGITLICLGSCSFLSQSVFRGMVAPVGVIVFGLVTLALFVQARVAAVTRAPVAAIMDPEVQMLVRKRAAERKAAEEQSRLATGTTDADAAQRPGSGA